MPNGKQTLGCSARTPKAMPALPLIQLPVLTRLQGLPRLNVLTTSR